MLVLAKTGLDRMRQAKKEINKCKTRIPLKFDPGGKIQKKNSKKIKKIKKTTFRRYFQPKRDEIGRERDKRILEPNSAHTRPGGANYKKKIAKKFKKLENNYSALFLSKLGLYPGEKIPKKNSKKIQKN